MLTLLLIAHTVITALVSSKPYAILSIPAPWLNRFGLIFEQFFNSPTQLLFGRYSTLGPLTVRDFWVVSMGFAFKLVTQWLSTHCGLHIVRLFMVIPLLHAQLSRIALNSYFDAISPLYSPPGTLPVLANSLLSSFNSLTSLPSCIYFSLRSLVWIGGGLSNAVPVLGTR